MDVCFPVFWMKHLNIETVGWSKTLLNNRLLLKGITFAKMCDTFWQEPFYIKITWLINLTDVIFTQVERVSTRIFSMRNLTYVINKKEGCRPRKNGKKNFFVSKSYKCNIWTQISIPQLQVRGALSGGWWGMLMSVGVESSHWQLAKRLRSWASSEADCECPLYSTLSI